MCRTFAANTNEEYMEDIAIIDFPRATVSAARKPGAAPKDKPSVQKFLDEGEALKARVDKHRAGSERGNEALYALLQEVYSFALSVEESPLEELIVAKMERALAAAKIKVAENTPFMTLVVKYVLRSDRQTAHTYSRALRVAYEEGIEDAGLAAFLKEKGGVGKVTMTEASRKKCKDDRDAATQRMCAYREMLTWQARARKGTARIDGKRVLRTQSTSEQGKPGTFVILIALEDVKNSELHVMSSYEVTKVFEDGLLKEVLKNVPGTTAEIRSLASEYESQAKNQKQAS